MKCSYVGDQRGERLSRVRRLEVPTLFALCLLDRGEAVGRRPRVATAEVRAVEPHARRHLGKRRIPSPRERHGLAHHRVEASLAGRGRARGAHRHDLRGDAGQREADPDPDRRAHGAHRDVHARRGRGCPARELLRELEPRVHEREVAQRARASLRDSDLRAAAGLVAPRLRLRLRHAAGHEAEGRARTAGGEQLRPRALVVRARRQGEGHAEAERRAVERGGHRRSTRPSRT